MPNTRALRLKAGRTRLNILMLVSAIGVCVTFLYAQAIGIRYPGLLGTVGALLLCFFVCRKKRWAVICYQIMSALVIVLGVVLALMLLMLLLKYISTMSNGFEEKEKEALFLFHYVVRGIWHGISIMALHRDPVQYYLKSQ